MRLAYLAVLVWSGLAIGEARPATLRVPSEYATIQAGLDASVAGDTVLVAPGTYTDTQTRSPAGVATTACVFMRDGAVLRSEAGPLETTIDMQHGPGPYPNVLYLLYLTSGQTVVEGFTVTGARVGGSGALTAFGGLITVRDCVFRDLDAGESNGGGIAANGNLRLEECEFVNCMASGGGAIYHANGRIEMSDTVVRACGQIGALLRGNPGEPIESSLVERCTFEGCWAGDSGGVAALQVDSHHGGSTVRDCAFIRNVGTGPDGAVAITGFPSSPMLVEGCVFAENTASGAQGRGALTMYASGLVRNCTFYANTSTQDGSAIYFQGTVRGLTNSVFLANVSGSGGAVRGIPTDSACNVFWDNLPGYTVSPTDRIVDPLLCDPAAGEFGLRAGSPCLPESSLGCGLIGAFGEDCGTITIDPTSWGSVKAAYRGTEGGTR